MLLDTKSHAWPQSTQLFPNMGLYREGRVSENMAGTQALPMISFQLWVKTRFLSDTTRLKCLCLGSTVSSGDHVLDPGGCVQNGCLVGAPRSSVIKTTLMLRLSSCLVLPPSQTQKRTPLSPFKNQPWRGRGQTSTP